MGVPCRYDLDPKSCVNDEVKVYNIKLKKHLKVFGNTRVIEVDANRDLFTRHGLHMSRMVAMKFRTGQEDSLNLDGFSITS